MSRTKSIAALLLMCLPALTKAAELTIELPASSKPRSAVATARELKLDTQAIIQGDTVTATGLLPDTPYDLSIHLQDGTILQGVDLSWYNEEPRNPDVGDLTDEDQAGIHAIISDIPSFYDKCQALLLRGDHDRAVALVQLVRERDFHAGKGNIIWRIELWYFKYQAGGWEKIAQQNQVLRRERYADARAYQAATAKIRWIPQLGGLRLSKDEPPRRLTLPPAALAGEAAKPAPATSPATAP